MTKTKIAIYARQSRSKETNGSIEDQVLKGQAKAIQLGKECEIYVDRGASAASHDTNNRPEFNRLMADIENGKFHDVFVTDCSRLTRHPLTEVIIKQTFQDHNVLLHTEMEGVIDYKNSTGELMAGLYALVNRKTVKDNTEKLKSVLKNRAINNKAHTGALKPFGYKADENKYLVIDEEEAVIVKRIFDYSSKGYGTQKIAEILNSEGIETKGRKVLKNGIRRNKGTEQEIHILNEELRWCGNTILSMLKNTIYKGQRIYKGMPLSAPIIISENTWDLVQSSLARNRNRQGDIKHQYLLKNLCKCGRCGRNIVGRTRISKRDNYYYCASKIKKECCGFRSINIDFLDEVIWYAVINSNQIQDIALNEIKKLSNANYISELTTELLKLENMLNNLGNIKSRVLKTYELGYADENELKLKLDVNKQEVFKIQERIKVTKDKILDNKKYISSINRLIDFQSMMEKIKYDTDFDTKRILVNMFIEKIVLDFDAVEEIYSIKPNIKLPNLSINGDVVVDEHVFYLNKGEKPNLLNYEPKEDRFLRKLSQDDSTLPFEKIERNGKIVFRNVIKKQSVTCPPVHTSNLTNRMVWRSIRSNRH
ncbi:MAG: recombinase family protein [Pedobacter sp.]|nr:MAG: recombinase family protein [Pedobacter sp.]